MTHSRTGVAWSRFRAFVTPTFSGSCSEASSFRWPDIHQWLCWRLSLLHTLVALHPFRTTAYNGPLWTAVMYYVARPSAEPNPVQDLHRIPVGYLLILERKESPPIPTTVTLVVTGTLVG